MGTAATGDSPQVQMSLLATGRFLTIFSTYALRFYTGWPKLKVLPVELPIVRAPVGIATLKNRTLSPIAQLFIDTAREVAKPPPRVSDHESRRHRGQGRDVSRAGGPGGPADAQSGRRAGSE